MTSCILLFAYGTLCRGERADITLLKPAARFICRATVLGLLFDAGECPILVQPGQGKLVHGELMSVPRSILEQLDAYERSCGDYAMSEHLVCLETGGCALAQLYAAPSSRHPDFPPIPSGCWQTYRQSLPV